MRCAEVSGSVRKVHASIIPRTLCCKAGEHPTADIFKVCLFLVSSGAVFCELSAVYTELKADTT